MISNCSLRNSTLKLEIFAIYESVITRAHCNMFSEFLKVILVKFLKRKKYTSLLKTKVKNGIFL